MAAAPACKKTAKEKAPPPASMPIEGAGSAAKTHPTTPGSAATATMTDPQIAAIVVAANQADIDAAQLALKKSKNEEVKKFAQLMITDHTAVNKSATALATKLGVKPEESDASRKLASRGAATRAKLDKLDGDAFDRAYIDNEVAYHKDVIAELDSQLIPSATNAELKNTLVGAKPTFDAHLQQAMKVQATLTGAGSAERKPHNM